MKKLFILFTLLLQLLSPIYPQQAATVITPSLKYGKPAKEELLFTTYTPDCQDGCPGLCTAQRFWREIS